jgi:hypothetical protein
VFSFLQGQSPVPLPGPLPFGVKADWKRGSGRDILVELARAFCWVVGSLEIV